MSDRNGVGREAHCSGFASQRGDRDRRRHLSQRTEAIKPAAIAVRAVPATSVDAPEGVYVEFVLKFARQAELS